jgi:hypothetical protein
MDRAVASQSQLASTGDGSDAAGQGYESWVEHPGDLISADGFAHQANQAIGSKGHKLRGTMPCEHYSNTMSGMGQPPFGL